MANLNNQAAVKRYALDMARARGRRKSAEYPNHELARILRELAKRAEVCELTLVDGHFPAIDLNGNRVGQLRVED